jgi:hypothetical protein
MGIPACISGRVYYKVSLTRTISERKLTSELGAQQKIEVISIPVYPP